MAMVRCKECGSEISENANTCPHCGDVIKEPKTKFSFLDLIHRISVPVILSVAGTVITVLTYFSMEEERQMEQTRKLLADAFDKDPIKQQYCVFYVDHLLASGRISPEMAVSVLSTVTANASTDPVRLEALRMLPQLLKQENYRPELKPLLVRSITSLIPTVSDVDILRRQLMLDMQTLVEADESYRDALIAELSAMDESWRFIHGSGEGSDQKQIRVGLQIKLALLSLVQDYRRLKEIAAGLIELAKTSAELSKFASDELDILSFSSRRTAVRVISGSALQTLRSGNSLPPPLGERDKSAPAVFIVAGDESQRRQAEQLAQTLKENGVAVQGVDVASHAKDARLSAPDNPEIRFPKSMNGNPLLSGLAETLKKNTGQEPKLVGISDPASLDPGTYEIWFSKN